MHQTFSNIFFILFIINNVSAVSSNTNHVLCILFLPFCPSIDDFSYSIIIERL